MKDKIKLSVGKNTFRVTLEVNRSAKALIELLRNGSIEVACYNYGGFEKVCTLDKTLVSNDSHITTRAGDVMLYNGNKIVIFYASNNWAYTRLGKVDKEYIDQLRSILSGPDTSVTISLTNI